MQSGFTPMVNANEDERSRSKVRKSKMEEDEDGLMMGSTKMEEDIGSLDGEKGLMIMMTH